VTALRTRATGRSSPARWRKAGTLAVRYDKRGFGQSGGRAESATLTEHAEDSPRVGCAG
jgi:hypothetical protein